MWVWLPAKTVKIERLTGCCISERKVMDDALQGIFIIFQENVL